MKTAFCILTCLLLMSFATQARTAEPSPQQKKQADEAPSLKIQDSGIDLAVVSPISRIPAPVIRRKAA